jgi:hypothetical protein
MHFNFGHISLLVFVLCGSVAEEEFSYMIISHVATIKTEVHNKVVCKS